MNARLAEIHPATHTAETDTHADTHAVREAVHIPLLRIRPSATNPRKHFDPAALADLARSIKEHGLLQPILVRPIPPVGVVEYEIVAGERRWQASKLPEAGEPYTIMAIARAMSDFEVLEVQVIENLKRTDLHPLEEAAGYEALLRKPDGGTGQAQGYANVDELAARVGKSPSFIWQRRKLLALGPEAREAFLAGKLQLSIAILVARLQPADQVEATAAILRGWGGEPMTFRAAALHINQHYYLELDKAIFKITDAALVPGAGSCRDCAKRTGANPDLFDDVKKHDTCTDAKCYAAKEAAHRAQLKAAAEAEGKTVITGKEAKAAMPQQHGGLKGYLELDREHHTLGDKPLRKLLGKKAPETLLLEDPHTKALVEVVREADALAVLKEADVIKTTKMPTTGAAERDADRKAKAERAWRSVAAAECVRLAAEPNAAFRAGLPWTVAATLWGELHSDVQNLVLKLLGWPPLRHSWASGPGITAAQHIAGLSADQLAAYFVAVAIAGDTQVSTHSTDRKPERLLATAEALGVDVAAIKQEQRQLAKETPAAKAAERARKKAAEMTPALTPETALAGALKEAAAKAATKKPAVRYRDAATGSTWSGRGLQPRWLKVALDGGRTLAEFDMAAGNGPSTAPSTAPAAAPILSAAAADPFRVL